METNIIEKKLREAAIKEAVRKYEDGIFEIARNPITRDLMDTSSVELKIEGEVVMVYSPFALEDVRKSILNYTEYLIGVKLKS